MKTNRDLALQFLRHFCAGDVEALAPLLAADLRFTGPLLQCRSRAAYLETLRSDPPDPTEYRVVSVTESEDAVAVFYDYQKPGETLPVAQLFLFGDGQIAELFLVFDTKGFR